MRDRGAMLTGALVVFVILFPIGFLLHAVPRFPGSLMGSLVGISGAVLMLIALLYVPLKRFPRLHEMVTRRVSDRTLLSVHIYAGVLGPILGVVHAAHKYDSPLGVTLTGVMVLAVISGYVGRFLLAQIARAVRGRKGDLVLLRTAFAETGTGDAPLPVTNVPREGGVNASARLLALVEPAAALPPIVHPGRQRLRLVGAIADTEYAIRSEEAANRSLSASLVAHIIFAILLSALLVLHIWSGLYYGLRWL